MHPTRSGKDRAEAKAQQELNDRVKSDYRKKATAARKEAAAAAAGVAAVPTPPPTAPRRAQAEAESASGDVTSCDDDDDPSFHVPEGELEADPNNGDDQDGDDQSGDGDGGETSGVVMADFDVENKEDPKDLTGKLHQILLQYDPTQVKWWVNRLELKMETFGVSAQWSKRVVLENNLPVEVQKELNELLAKRKTAAGDTIYKRQCY